VTGHPGLELVASALLQAHAVLLRKFKSLDKHTQKLARAHPSARLLMTTPSLAPDCGAHLCCSDRRSKALPFLEATASKTIVAKSTGSSAKCRIVVLSMKPREVSANSPERS